MVCVQLSGKYIRDIWFHVRNIEGNAIQNAKQLIAPRTHTVVRNMEFEFIDVGKHLGMDKLGAWVFRSNDS